MTYYYTLRIARKQRRCGRCKKEIRPGELYIDYHGFGMLTHYTHMRDSYCVKCKRRVAEDMLREGVRAMRGYAGTIPARDKPLSPELGERLRRELVR